MLLPESQLTPLKAYLKKQLNPITAADSDVLSDYVIALLKNDKPVTELKEFCLDSLEEFLGSEKDKFTDDLFEFLVKLENGEVPQEYVESTVVSKKRKYDNNYDNDAPSEDKHPKRRRKNFENDTQEEEMDSYDRRQPRRNYNNNRNDGGHRHRGNERNRDDYEERKRPRRPRNKGYCTDFEERGYCLRGELCPFIHDETRNNTQASYDVDNIYNPEDPLVLADESTNLVQWQNRQFIESGSDADKILRRGGSNSNTRAPPTQLVNTRGGRPVDEYNPLEMGLTSENNSYDNHYHNDDVDIESDEQIEEKPKEQKKNLKNTLLLTGVPKELNDISELSSHFSKFGKIVNIQVELSSKKANIQFSTTSETFKALKSPEAVLGNRFIRIFRADKYDSKKDPSNKGRFSEPEPDPDPAVILEQKKKEQQEKIQKQKEIEQQKIELAKKKISQQKELIAILTDRIKTVTEPQEKQELIQKVKGLTESLMKSLRAESTSLRAANDAIQRKLNPQGIRISQENTRELLDQELDEMAGNSSEGTDNVDENTIPNSDSTGSTFVHRGKPRGRARGGAPFNNAPDTRTSILQILNLHEDIRDEAKLKEHFTSFGTVNVTLKENNCAIVAFDTRQNAQVAVKAGASIDSIPLIMKWYNVKEDEVIEIPGTDSEFPTGEDAEEQPSPVVKAVKAEKKEEEEEDEEEAEKSWKR